MPNDCENYVTFRGDSETIAALREKKVEFDFFIPTPESCKDSMSWRIEHWGTKWPAYDYQEIAAGETALRVHFTTAWSPPLPFFKTLLSWYPDLWIKCEWIEEGGLAGVWVGRGMNENLERDVQIQELQWVDMCLEERAFLFKHSS